MPPIIPYLIASAPVAGQGWQASPYDYQRHRAMGRVHITSSSWRHQERATIQLVTVNHPRLARVGLDETLRRLIQNLAWAQRVPQSNIRETTRRFQRAEAHGLELTLSAGVTLSDPFLGIQLVDSTLRQTRVQAVAWTLDGMNEFAFIATADQAAWRLVDDLAARVEYENVRFPAFH